MLSLISSVVVCSWLLPLLFVAALSFLRLHLWWFVLELVRCFLSCVLFIILGSSLSVFLLIGFEVIFGRLQLLVLLFRFCFIIVLALYSCLSFVRERGLCPWCCCMVLLFVVCRCVCSDFVGFVSWSCFVDLAVFAFVICHVFLCDWVFLCVLVLCYVMPCLLFKFRVVVFV